MAAPQLRNPRPSTAATLSSWRELRLQLARSASSRPSCAQRLRSSHASPRLGACPRSGHERTHRVERGTAWPKESLRPLTLKCVRRVPCSSTSDTTLPRNHGMEQSSGTLAFEVSLETPDVQKRTWPNRNVPLASPWGFAAAKSQPDMSEC